MMRTLAIIGPTASGKSALAMDIAARVDAEIVSIDSRQIYKRLDIGTAKPSRDERRRVPHHLVDILELWERSNASSFARMAGEAVKAINFRGRLPILVGGSGLYLRALLEGLFEIGLDPSGRETFARSVTGEETGKLRERLIEADPESAARIHPNDRYRITRALEVLFLSGTTLSSHFRMQRDSTTPIAPFPCLKIGLDPGRELLHQRINSRTARMTEIGWIAEVEGLLRNGVDPAWPGMKTLGYPDVVAHIRGEMALDAMTDRISARTRQYAKRQMTWFRKERDVRWLDPGSADLSGTVLKLLDSAGIS